MNKKAVMTRGMKLCEEIGPRLAGSDVDKAASQVLIIEAFADVAEQAGLRRSVVLTQVGEAYKVEKSTNFLDISFTTRLTRAEVEQLIANGVTVTVQRNK